MINNSLKFSREEISPVIEISADPFFIEGESTWKITVRDNGIGFDPAHSTKIFNTFTRLNPKHKYDGTGLGLSLSKKIAERHNGSITADGTPNAGAVFTITLPEKQQGVLTHKTSR